MSAERILVVTQYYFPENFKSNDLVADLVKRGYEVDVLTGLPNYPSGRIFKGYGLFRRRRERIDGARVFRALLIPRGAGGGLRLMLNYLSWAFFASFWAVWLALRNKYVCVIVHEPSPITQGLPAILAKKIRKIPLYFWVMDLWPESLASAGGVTSSRVLNLVDAFVRWVYRNSDRILITSQGFRESILSKGDFADRIVWLPNWAEDIFAGGEGASVPELPAGFRIMFAGNVGEAQDFESIMQAALLLRDEPRVKWIVVGDGRKRAWAEEFVRTNDLGQTVSFLGQWPLEAMPSFFRQADVMLVTLKDELIFNLTVPAKLQAYMAAAKPVLAMLNGEGGNIVREAGCGRAVPAGDSEALCQQVRSLLRADTEELGAMAQRGHAYYLQNFTKKICMDRFCAVIRREL